MSLHLLSLSRITSNIVVRIVLSKAGLSEDFSEINRLRSPKTDPYTVILYTLSWCYIPDLSTSYMESFNGSPVLGIV